MENADKKDRTEVSLDLDIFILKPSELLILPDTPNIYLTQEKAAKFLKDLSAAVENSKEGVIIKLNGPVNPRLKNEDEDESMFLTKELKSGKVREHNP